MGSQAELERLLVQREAQVEKGILTFQQAYGRLEEWMLQIGVRKAFLHPNLKQWLWFDRLHNQWAYAGCGVNEAILLAVGRTAGMKKLPQPGPVAAWCVYRRAEVLIGPLRLRELHENLKMGKLPVDGAVWSTCSTRWLKIAALDERSLSLGNMKGETVVRLSEAGLQVKAEKE